MIAPSESSSDGHERLQPLAMDYECLARETLTAVGKFDHPHAESNPVSAVCQVARDQATALRLLEYLQPSPASDGGTPSPTSAPSGAGTSTCGDDAACPSLGDCYGILASEDDYGIRGGQGRSSESLESLGQTALTTGVLIGGIFILGFACYGIAALAAWLLS